MGTNPHTPLITGAAILIITSKFEYGVTSGYLVFITVISFFTLYIISIMTDLKILQIK